MLVEILIGRNGGDPRRNVARAGAPQMTIETPAMTLAELNRVTGNFGPNRLIGEGSYGKVYYGKLSDGRHVAIKKLDTSNSSPEDDAEFKAQVRPRITSCDYN